MVLVRVEEMEARELTPRVIVNQTRMEGKVPIFIAEIGDKVFYAQATGNVAAGLTLRVYLTVNGEARGENRFGMGMPMVTVQRDVLRTRGGLTRASGPSAPESNLQLRAEDGHDLIWDGANQVWAVDIINGSGGEANYMIQARGLK